MDAEQMNLEHERLTEEEIAVCEEVKEIIEGYGESAKEWESRYRDIEEKFSTLACENFNLKTNYLDLKKSFDQTSGDVWELKKQLSDTESRLKESEEKLNLYKIRFLAVKTLTDITANATLSHAQRKALALVENSLLTSLVEGKEEVDPIPF